MTTGGFASSFLSPMIHVTVIKFRLSLIFLLAFAASSIFLAVPASAQGQVAEPPPAATQPVQDKTVPAEATAPDSPATSAAPEEPTPAPAVSPAQASPAEAASPTPPLPLMSRREIIDAMSMADLQEAITQIRENSIRATQINDLELSRAMLEGLLVRLGTAGELLQSDAVTAEQHDPKPFYAEILDGRIGYVRLGTLGEGTPAALDAALANFVASGIRSAVVDLRTTSGGSLETAVGVLKRFMPNGSLLFTVRRPGEKQERLFTNGQEPGFRGLLVVVADKGTSGAGEIVAEALRGGVQAMVVGAPTAGRAVEYADRKLKGGQVLRLAVAEVSIPGRPAIFPDGVLPDIEVPMKEEVRAEILDAADEHGVSQFVFDKKRPRMNEAALLAGETPELDTYQEMQRNGGGQKKVLRDTVLQRAVDLITVISIYERKPASGE